jgi:RNA recognition motif-containing protein
LTIKGNPQSNQRIVGTPVAIKIAQQPDKNRPPPATDSNPQNKPTAQDSCPLTLHISFLETTVTEETLRSIFEPFGIVS